MLKANKSRSNHPSLNRGEYVVQITQRYSDHIACVVSTVTHLQLKEDKGIKGVSPLQDSFFDFFKSVLRQSCPIYGFVH